MKTKIERITNKINSNKELITNIENLNYYNVEDFIRDANSYIKAINEGRVICNIESVSRSGMSRNIKFLACEKSKKSSQHSYRQFWAFFKSLSFTEVNRTQVFRISGCGMDMIFHTNYTIIHNLKRLGFISSKKCKKLAQLTPTVIQISLFLRTCNLTLQVLKNKTTKKKLTFINKKDLQN